METKARTAGVVWPGIPFALSLASKPIADIVSPIPCMHIAARDTIRCEWLHTDTSIYVYYTMVLMAAQAEF